MYDKNIRQRFAVQCTHPLVRFFSLALEISFRSAGMLTVRVGNKNIGMFWRNMAFFENFKVLVGFFKS